MSNVMPFKQRHKARSVSIGLFIGFVAIAMAGSFAIGMGASLFIGDSTAVAQPSVTSRKIEPAYRSNEQKARNVSLTAKQPVVTYGHCSGAVRINCIVDGDTLWSNGIKIRIADIDTPEVGTPRCAAEKTLGEHATIRLMELVNAGPFHMQAWPGRDDDKYGRKLRVLVRDGRSIGDILVSEGLARTWTGKRRPWC